MSNQKSNFPAPAADRSLSGREFTGETVKSLAQLANKGIPQNETELQQRVDDFFGFCSEHNIRPGVESLSLSLGVSRVSFWKWCRDDCGKGREWVGICQTARQLIVSFTEQAAICGHLSPPIGIFLLKNLADYKDTISLEESMRDEVSDRPATNMELARKMGLVTEERSNEE